MAKTENTTSNKLAALMSAIPPSGEQTSVDKNTKSDKKTEETITKQVTTPVKPEKATRKKQTKSSRTSKPDKTMEDEKKALSDNKIGRPEIKDESKKKKNKVNTYLNDEDFQLLSKLAEENEVTIANYVRRVLRKHINDQG